MLQHENVTLTKLLSLIYGKMGTNYNVSSGKLLGCRIPFTKNNICMWIKKFPLVNILSQRKLDLQLNYSKNL